MSILGNKKCLVTGATRGIGKEITSLLKEEGCNILGVGSKDGDLTTIKGIYKLIDYTKQKLGQVEILINCAGIYHNNSINNSCRADYDDIFTINVQAPWLLCREFSPAMINNKWGRIVNIGSISSYEGFPNGSLYCSTKHALLGMSRALRGELKPYNIRVFCFSPSATKTDMGKDIPNEQYDTFLDPKEIAEYIIFAIKLNNNLISEEIRLNRFNK